MNSVQEEQDTSGSCHINVTLLDNTTNLFIKPEIRIASELKRLTKDQHPRDCINHESLLFVVENVVVFNNISPLAYKNDGKFLLFK
jgi:hypothetical protein